jgi:hypothetical protein
MIKRVKYWCIVVFLAYIYTCYMDSDEKRTESAARKTG